MLEYNTVIFQGKLDKMISLELLEEIILKSNKSIYIDKDLLERIITDVIEKEDYVTKKNFNGVVFKRINRKNVGCCYNTDSKKISIDYDKILKKNFWNDCLINNLEIVQSMLHEIQHVKETSKLQTKNIESYLIRLSDLKVIENMSLNELKTIKRFVTESFFNKLYDKKYKQIYIKLFDLIPGERIAEIDAYKYLLDSLLEYPNFKNEHHDAMEYLYSIYFGKNLFCYKLNRKKFRIPLLEYIKYINYFSKDEQDLLYKKLIKRSDLESLSVEDKIKYGFETNFDEVTEFRQKSLKYIV